MALNRFRKNYALVVSGGRVSIAHGQPPVRFVHEVTDIVRLKCIDTGRIECVGAGRLARLRFSKDFPEHGRQAIRNVWSPPRLARIAGPRGTG